MLAISGMLKRRNIISEWEKDVEPYLTQALADEAAASYDKDWAVIQAQY